MLNEVSSKIIFHIDVNSAFLSWTAAKLLKEGEELDLRTVPSIIGGDSDKRHGIVLAKSEPAKKLGISTAEPIVNALRKCPNLIIKPSDFTTYRENSAKLMEHLSSFCPEIEQVSIDECYMDFTPIAYKYSSPVEAAHIIKDSVREKFGFTVNIGISDRKVLAKMASDFEKPDKVHTLFSYEIQKKMWPLPVSDLYMCGKSSASHLYKLGIRTIGDLANYNLEVLELNLKSHGKLLYEFANGIDFSVVSTKHERLKGIGNSTTVSHDLTTKEESYAILLELAEKVTERLRKDGRKAGLVTVEIKYSDFVSTSHQTILAKPSDVRSSIYKISCELFDKLWNGEPIRLLGIRTSKLVEADEPYQMNIFDFTDEETIKKNNIEQKEEILDNALDSIRSKYGSSSVTKGYKKNNG